MSICRGAPPGRQTLRDIFAGPYAGGPGAGIHLRPQLLLDRDFTGALYYI